MKKIIQTLIFCFVSNLIFAQHLTPFKAINGKYGYKDDNGKKVIKAIYNTADYFHNGLAIVSQKINNQILYGYINMDGTEIIPLKYLNTYLFFEGLAMVKTIEKKLAFINLENQVQFYIKNGDYASVGFSNGYVRFGSYYYQGEGFLNKKGETVLAPIFKKVTQFNDGIATVTNKKGKVFEIDTNFNIKGTYKNVIPKEWVISNNGKYGLMHHEKIICEPKYHFAKKLDDGYSYVIIGEKFGIVDEEGNEIIAPKYDQFFFTNDDKNSLVSEGLLLVKNNGKMGYVDLKGNEISIIYKSAWHFKKGLALVTHFGENTNEDYIDKSGKVINPADGQLVNSFQTRIGTLEVFKPFYTSAFQGVGLRKGKEVLIYPYYQSITNDDDLIKCSLNSTMRQIPLNSFVEINPSKIELNEMQQFTCKVCEGRGEIYSPNTTSSAGSSTTSSYTTSYETRWNPATNKYEGYKVTKSNPSTKNEKDYDKVKQSSNSCTTCWGKGTIKGNRMAKLIWNARNYYYEID